MARLKVNPTRVEMRNLQRKLQIASRGHKLLKEKQDSLTQRYLQLSEEARTMRKQIDYDFDQIQTMYQRASLRQSNKIIDKHLDVQEHQARVHFEREHEMGIRVMGYELEIESHVGSIRSIFATSQDIRGVESVYATMLPQLIALAEIEKKCMIIGNEIKDTRRRVNALEYRTIPNLIETIRYIKMRVDENERSQKARVMKIK